MLSAFFRHGSNFLLAFAIVAILVWASLGGPHLGPLWVVVGALLFYLSEYFWHRFAFHAPPAPWAWMRRLQHRLHYDHHAEPSRLDLLFLPIWFPVPICSSRPDWSI
jgi:4-hydroxysphinganine ceramide fatty acyl 2-hydroxylase